MQRRHPVSIPRRRVCAVLNQRPDHLVPAPVRRAMQRRACVAIACIDEGAVAQEELCYSVTAVLRGCMQRCARRRLDASLPPRDVQRVDTRTLPQEFLNLLQVPVARCQHQRGAEVGRSRNLSGLLRARACCTSVAVLCPWAARKRAWRVAAAAADAFTASASAAASAAFSGCDTHGSLPLCRRSRGGPRSGRLWVVAAAAQVPYAAATFCRPASRPQRRVLQSSARTCTARATIASVGR